VRRIGSHHRQPRKAEVGHGPRRRSYIEGVARRNKHHADAVALVFSQQEMIVAGRQGKVDLFADPELAETDDFGLFSI
jgi:hypothetical protein